MERIKKQRVLSLTLLAVVCLIGALFIGMRVVHATPYTIADDIGGSVGLGTADLKTTVINIIKWVLGILALVAVSFIIYGGFIWLTAAGNVEKIQKAKRIIINAVIGLVIVLISWAIVIFVTKFITGATSGGGPGSIPCVQGDPKCPWPPDIGLEIRSITTDCKNADLEDYRHDVFICSAINITFNHTLTGLSVENAVKNAGLIVEQCTGVDGAENCADADVVPVVGDSALDGILGNVGVDPQQFVNAASGTYSTDIQKGASWAARLDNSGKNITFFHIKTLFDKFTWFRVTIPKTLIDTKGKALSDCLATDCFDNNTEYTWTMQTGEDVDTQSPVVTNGYPDIRYLPQFGAKFQPDRSVPRTPTINLHYSKAVLPPTSVTITPFDSTKPTPDPVTGTGGTLLGPLDPADYTVYPGGDGRSLFIQMKQHDKCDTGATNKCLGGSEKNEACKVDTDCPDFRMLEKFTWYKVSVGGVIDLCSNLQKPNPFEWVFETNDVVPNASVYPPDGYDNSCPSTPAFIRYTVSMYNSENGSCDVAGGGGGHVTGYTFRTSTNAFSGKEGTIRIDDPCPGGDCSKVNPANYCKVYSFPVTPNLTPNTTYDVGIANNFVIDDKATTLSWGTSTDLWGGDYNSDAKKGWSFKVKEPDKCADPPVITSIDPEKGTDGQCVTVHGYNFDGNKDGALRDGTGSAGDVDDLQYEGANIPDANLGKWSDVQVAAEVPAGGAIGPKTFKVKSKFPDPFGILESTDTVPNWEKIPGPASTAACLLSLEPDKGIVGSQFNAIGRRFGSDTQATKIVHFDTQNLSAPSWNDTRITGITVPDIAPNIYPVWIENDKGDSNSLNYEVTPIPPGQPVVADHWPNCSASCLTADIGAKFGFADKNAEIDQGSLTVASVLLRRCTDDKCTKFDLDVAVTITTEPTIVRIIPQANLDASKWYRVVLLDTIKGATTPNDGTLGGLNYRFAPGAGNNDAFSWTFRTTKIGAEGCKLDRVVVNPATYAMHTLDETKPYTAESYTEPNDCSASGQPMTASTNWSPWTSTGTAPPRAPGFEYITLAPGANPWQQVVTAKNESVPDKFTVEAHGDKDGVAKSGAGILVTDFSYCNDDATCQKNGCTGSICNKQSHRCTPYIKSFSPAHGDIGTWVGIDGCYFGNYVKGKCRMIKEGDLCDSNLDCFDGATYGLCMDGSAVQFTPGKLALWPDTKRCGPINWTCSNFYTCHITAEVPNRVTNDDATDGPIRVFRWDAQSLPSTTLYDVDNTKMPGICRAEPSRGSTGTKVKLTGQNFGAQQNMSKIFFYKEKESTPVASWSDIQIVTPAPADIANNVEESYAYPAGNFWSWHTEIRANVVAGTSEWSNTVNFDVLPPGCVACVNDIECGAGKGCGYSGCCAAIPKVIDKQPPDGKTDVCRNSLVSAEFDMAMDPTTINKSTAHLYRYDDKLKGNIAVESAKISYNKKSFTMSFDAGLLERNTTYSVSLSEGGELVRNGNFEDGSGTFPTGWVGMDPAYAASITQSPDISNQVTPGTKSLHLDAATQRCNGSSGPLAGNPCNVNNDCNTVNPMGKCARPSLYAYQLLDVNSTQKRSFRVTGWVRLRNTASPFNAVGGLITQCWSTVDPWKSNIWAPPCDQDGKTFDLYNNAPGLKWILPGQDTGWVQIDYIITNNTGANIAPKILCFATPGTDVWCDEVSVRQVSEVQRIRSAEGAALPATQWSFTTADMDGPCQVSRVGIEPSAWTFWTSDPTKKESGKDFTAHAYSDRGTELIEVPGMLEWSWSWYIKNGSPFKFSAPADLIHPQTPGFPDVDTAIVEANPAKGKGYLMAMVNPIPQIKGGPIGQTNIITGISTITVNACNNPWFPINTDTYGYVDSNNPPASAAKNKCTIVNIGAVCTDYHFNIGYCRDGQLGKCDKITNKCTSGSRVGQNCAGTDNLCPEFPVLAVTAVTQYRTEGVSSKPVLLKEFLFKEPSNIQTKDAIGMRIYDNFEGLSALEWYKKYATKARSAPAPKSVDGYDGIQDGTSVYVGGSDLADLDNKLHSKIFILSYNAGADAKIISIYNQMLESWFFNNNPVLASACGVNANPEEPEETLKICAQRDLRRVAGLSDIVQYLRAYRSVNKTYPKLGAGSYLANMSFSVWPSWQKTLGGDLKQSLPVDPKNTIQNCPTAQSQDGSCWSELNKTFICKPGPANIFGYYTTPDGLTANLYANLEYSGPSSWINFPGGTGPPCPAGSKCDCFNYSFGP
ncbi:MAG: Ig-like domain-containing protein [Candidatus Kerfeldbacteria bacterium]